MKPRLSKHHGYWYCVGEKSCGLGITPKTAFMNWLKQAIVHAQVLECSKRGGQ